MKYHKKVGTTTIIVITLFAFLYISNLVCQNVKSSNSSNQISAKQITSTHNKITQGLTVYMLPVINEMRPMQKNVVHLTQISTAPQLNGNKFTYGTLLVELPDGVTIEQRRSEGIYNVVDFINTKNDENKENSAFHNAPFLQEYGLHIIKLIIQTDICRAVSGRWQALCWIFCRILH